MSIESRVEELLQLPWSREIIADADGVYIAVIPELRGCFAEGDSVQDALTELNEEILPEWLALAVEDGQEIPYPRRVEHTYVFTDGEREILRSKNVHRQGM